MPITQSRMISLINASLDYQIAFEKACNIVKREKGLAQEGRQSIEDALHNICAFITPVLLHNPADSKAIIAIERRHFASSKNRNIKAAAKAAMARAKTKPTGTRPQRQGQGVFLEMPEVRSTAPSSMRHDDRLGGSLYDQVMQEQEAEGQGQGQGQAQGKAIVNPFDPLAEDEIDFESVIKGSRLSAEAKRQIQAQVEAEASQEALPGEEPEAKAKPEGTIANEAES